MAPRSPIVLGQGPGVDLGIGHVYERQGRYDAAVREYLTVDSLSGVTTAQVVRLRRAYEQAGIRGYWRLRSEQMERDASGHPDPVRLSWMWARAGDHARAVGWVQRAYRERSIGLVFLGVIPGLDGVRRDSRVAAIMDAMRLQVAAPSAERTHLAEHDR
jgi:hypothetical protein